MKTAQKTYASRHEDWDRFFVEAFRIYTTIERAGGLTKISEKWTATQRTAFVARMEHIIESSRELIREMGDVEEGLS